ncbi:MAG TPA: DUF1206 domain-containing protein [Acidimicrobiales bacterium]|nr:DUF1206 domain-containing protein [Acidimicrobiales bacterium]
MSTTAQQVRHAGHRAARGDWVERAGRIGLVAKGVSYALIGILAIQIPLGQGGQAADRQGVLRELANEPWGTAALIALAIGFACYGVWRLIEAVVDRRNDGTDAKGLAKRAKSLGLAVIYFASAVTAVMLVRSSSASTVGNEQQETARVLEWPAGRWIVLAAGLGLLAEGVYSAYRGVTRKFLERLKTEEMHQATERFATASGVVGHVARGAVFAVVGVFLAKAAIEYDPNEAVGIDGALLKVVEASYGTLLLALVAAGLIAYAVYCFVEARYRRI